MTVFTILTLILMIIGIGIGADFMRYETYRAELQNALDRGALAATSFGQTEDPTTVIHQYVNDSVRWEQTGLTPVVSVVRSPADDTWFTADVAERSVSATASLEFRSHFIRLLDGVSNDTLSINVSAGSSQRQKRTEVVLVLDVSFSMDGNDTALSTPKITVLKQEAQKFVNQLLTPETEGSTTVTLVPFGGHVNPGVFGELMQNDVATLVEPDGSLTTVTSGVTPLQFPPSPDLAGDPFCPVFHDDEFLDPLNAAAADQLDLRRVRDQRTWFKAYGKEENDSNTGLPRWGWCPFSDTVIVPMSNDATAINTAIQDMKLFAGTGIDVALKWASYLSSNESNPAIQEIMSTYPNMIDSKFVNRPAPDSDSDTNKIIVFLTDGEITHQREIRPMLMGVDGSLTDDGLDAYTVADLRAELDEAQDDATHPYASAFNLDEADLILDHMDAHVGPNGLLADFWAIPTATDQNKATGNSSLNHPIEWNDSVGVQDSHFFPRGKLDALKNVEYLCDRLRARGNVQVFTIGFNIAGLEGDDFVVPADAETAITNKEAAEYVLGHCAIDPGDGSDASNRYLASGTNLGSVFSDISTEIFSLKLTN